MNKPTWFKMRCTKEERTRWMALARKAGRPSLSKFIRDLLESNRIRTNMREGKENPYATTD